MAGKKISRNTFLKGAGVLGGAALVGKTTYASDSLKEGKKEEIDERQLLAKKLNTKALTQTFVGNEIYGFTSHSQSPYVIQFKKDNSVLMTIAKNEYHGSYEIKKDQVFTNWEKPYYQSNNLDSNYHPENPKNKQLIEGKIGIEFWELENISGTKRVFIKRHDDHKHEWGSPCFLYYSSV